MSADFAEATPAESSTFDELTYWWAALDDPLLNALIAEACQQNLDLREAYYRVAVARAELGVVRADRLPQADAVAGYAWRDFSENASQFISSTAGNRGFSFHRLGFDTSWEIDLFGKIARSIESAEAEVVAQIESQRDVKVTLLAEVATAYVRLRVAQARLEIAERNLAAQRNTFSIVRDRHDSGLVSPLDVAQAESNVFRTAATIPQLRQLESTAVNQLALLLGRTPDENFVARLTAGPAPILPQSLGVGVPAELLSRRPDVRRAQRQVATASAQIGSAVAEKYPQISILGTISVEARDIDMLFSNGSLAHSVGPRLRWNILNFNQLNNVIAKRSSEFRAAVINYQRTVLRAVQEVEDGLVAFHRQGERADQLQRAVEATQRAVSSSEVRYERGLIGFQPVLDSQRELLSVEDALATSHAETLLGLIRVYKALGGGWNSQCACEVIADAHRLESIETGEEVQPESESELPSPSSTVPAIPTPNEAITHSTYASPGLSAVHRSAYISTPHKRSEGAGSNAGPPVLPAPRFPQFPVVAAEPTGTRVPLTKHSQVIDKLQTVAVEILQQCCRFSLETHPCGAARAESADIPILQADPDFE